jgi:arylsulfatase A-like enzyme
MYPTLLGLAGGKPAKDKPLDGLDVWPTISRGAPSPRHEVVYDIEPYRAALRQGDWKLVWRTVLPPKLELFDLARDPSQTTNLADANPQVVAQMKQRIEALSREAVPPLILKDAFGAVRQELRGAVSLPDAGAVDEQP